VALQGGSATSIATKEKGDLVAEWLIHFDHTWLIYALAVATTAFPILYARFAPFYRSWLGITIFTLGVALALLADMTLLFRVWEPPLSWRAFITTFVFGLILVASIAKSVILIKTQVSHRGARRNSHADQRL
jgi:hypothetical protein